MGSSLFWSAGSVEKTHDSWIACIRAHAQLVRAIVSTMQAARSLSAIVLALLFCFNLALAGGKVLCMYGVNLVNNKVLRTLLDF